MPHKHTRTHPRRQWMNAAILCGAFALAAREHFADTPYGVIADWAAASVVVLIRWPHI